MESLRRVQSETRREIRIELRKILNLRNEEKKGNLLKRSGKL